jgi:hypothetical protein
MHTEPPDPERLITCRTIVVFVVLAVIVLIVVLAFLGPIIGNLDPNNLGGPL